MYALLKNVMSVNLIKICFNSIYFQILSFNTLYALNTSGYASLSVSSSSVNTNRFCLHITAMPDRTT